MRGYGDQFVPIVECVNGLIIRLNLSRSRLDSLPPEIGQLTGLEELDLNGAVLTSLPPEIGQLTSLWSLQLSGNPLRNLPPEICAALKRAIDASRLCP
jgi:Leucine-rich repeat (LRR) protein